MTRNAVLVAGLLGASLLAGCADGPEDTLAADPVADSQGGVDSLTGLGEADDPLAAGSGGMGGGGDVAGSEM